MDFKQKKHNNFYIKDSSFRLHTNYIKSLRSQQDEGVNTMGRCGFEENQLNTSKEIQEIYVMAVNLIIYLNFVVKQSCFFL